MSINNCGAGTVIVNRKIQKYQLSASPTFMTTNTKFLLPFYNFLWSSVAQLVEAWLSISVVVSGLGLIPRGTHFFLTLFISVFSIFLNVMSINSRWIRMHSCFHFPLAFSFCSPSFNLTFIFFLQPILHNIYEHHHFHFFSFFGIITFPALIFFFLENRLCFVCH